MPDHEITSDAPCMAAFLNGWLLSTVLGDGKKAMKITTVEIEATDSFVVIFASGLRLSVSVKEQPCPTTK